MSLQTASLPPQECGYAKTDAGRAEVGGRSLGLMAADVVRRIERAGDEARLLNVLGRWRMAMRDSKHGRPVADACLERIEASLRDGAESVWAPTGATG